MTQSTLTSPARRELALLFQSTGANTALTHRLRESGWRHALLAMLLALLVAVIAPPQSASADEAPAPAAAAQVNINKADAQTLAAGLKGIGQARAQEIVRYRETFGPFASAEELMEVKGIGQSTLNMNRAVITLE